MAVAKLDTISTLFYKNRIDLLLILICLFISSQVYAQNYYVSSSEGNDNNKGTSIKAPWKTLSKVENYSFSPGDSIYLKCGDIWREDLHFPSSGSKDANIIISSYGTGKQPIISGAMILKNWIPSLYGFYKSPYSGTCYSLLEDSKHLKKANDLTDLKPGFWYQDNKFLYYYPTHGNPSEHLIERCSKGACIFITNKHNLIIQKLYLYGANADGILIRDSNHIKILNCTITLNGIQGIELSREKRQADCSNIYIKNCTITRNGNGIYIKAPAGGYQGSGYNSCEIINNEIAYNDFGEKLSHLTKDGHAIGIQNSNYITISGNKIHHNYSGIALWTAPKYYSNNNKIIQNFIYKNQFFGISQGGEGSNNSYNNIWGWNIIVENGMLPDKMSGGMRINRNNYNLFIYNTLYKNDVNIFLYSLTNQQVIQYNISVDPIKYHIIIEPSAGEKNLIDKNIYYSEKIAKFYYKNKVARNINSWQKISHYDLNSSYGDPKFEKKSSPDNPIYYKLKSNSPYININNSYSQYDLSGNNIDIKDIKFKKNIILSPSNLHLLQ